jgi:tRNA nucleotidyltransferase/poly(A) polymerase
MPQIFLVGGIVRDELLGVKSKDIDFSFVLDDCDVTISEGFQTMKTYMEEKGFEIFLCTEDCLTIRAKFPKGDQNEGLVADFVLARKEDGYIEDTRKPFVKPGSIGDDLIRRDFTVNALAKNMDGSIIDMFNGQEDLKNKILRTPTDPIITMMDDPLRILRALRFAITKGFEIHPTIWNAMRQPQILEKLKTTVSAERIRDEVFKMMKHDTSETIRLFHYVDTHHIPGFINLVFSKGLWLEPTFKQ